MGSNLGDREGFLALARRRLGELPGTELLAASRIEETAPLGGRSQPSYLNQMVAVRTGLSPRELLAACQGIEREAGRERREQWASRTLDLDLVRYDDVVVDDPDFILPHPGLRDRDFWQRELAELTAPEQ